VSTSHSPNARPTSCRIILLIAAVLLATGGVRANLIGTTSYLFSASSDRGTSGTVSQTISTTPGETYEISFQGNLSSLYTPTSLNFQFGDLLNESLADQLGHQYYLWNFHLSDSSLATFNYFVTADAASSTLAFQYYLTSENYGMSIHNLTVNPVPDGASTAGLLSVAVTGVLFIRRRFNRSR
jgi:hypothetical protein